ncbi:MAG: Na+/H+ antiporter, partial [Limisphaerales bacterium]
MSPLLRWLGVVTGHQEQETYELTRGKLQAAKAALEALDQMAHVHFSQPQVLAILRQEYEQTVQHDRLVLDGLRLEKRQLEADELRWARRHLLLVEKGEVIDAFHRGVLSQVVHEKLLADIDARLLRLESGETDGPVPQGPLAEPPANHGGAERTDMS